MRQVSDLQIAAQSMWSDSVFQSALSGWTGPSPDVNRIGFQALASDGLAAVPHRSEDLPGQSSEGGSRHESRRLYIPHQTEMTPGCICSVARNSGAWISMPGL